MLECDNVYMHMSVWCEISEYEASTTECIKDFTAG